MRPPGPGGYPGGREGGGQLGINHARMCVLKVTDMGPFSASSE